MSNRPDYKDERHEDIVARMLRDTAKSVENGELIAVNGKPWWRYTDHDDYVHIEFNIRIKKIK